MNRPRQFDTKVLVATVCVAASGWLSAQAQSASTDSPGRANQSRLQQSAMTTEPDEPMLMVNKCSKLVGAKVKDATGNVLGKIDDVVVDFNSGRVSYCALKVKESHAKGAKYVAIPLAALHPSVDGLYLILNADKDKVAQTKGFDKSNWPAVNNPAWGAEPFWQSAPATPPQEEYIPAARGSLTDPNRSVVPSTGPQPTQRNIAPDVVPSGTVH